MAKKKERNIFNIDEVNIEIDYDKLADAIAKANEKQSQQYSVSREWMKFIIYPVFWLTTIVTGVFAIGCVIYGGVNMYDAFKNNAIITTNPYDFITEFITGGFLICIGLFIAAISFATGMTAKEIDKETDRNYVAAMFSNVVALVALIVSLVALVKG